MAKTLRGYCEDLTDEQLLTEWAGLHDCVVVAECFSSQDVSLLAAVEMEMIHRHITLNDIRDHFDDPNLEPAYFELDA